MCIRDSINAEYMGNVKPIYEDFLEGLLNLYSKVGRLVEDSERKGIKDDVYEPKAAMAEINGLLENPDSTNHLEKSITVNLLFDIFEMFKIKGNISKRMCSLIENLVEKRENNWAESQFASEGPKKIDDLHREYEREQEEIDRRAAEYTDRMMKEGPSQPSRRGPPPSQSKWVEKADSKKTTFQVVSAPTDNTLKAEEETKSLDPNAVNKTLNTMSFRPQRDPKKQGTMEIPSAPAPEAETKTMHVAEIEKKVQEIFKNEATANPVDAFAEIFPKAKTIELIKAYFKFFCDGHQDDVKKRLGILLDLYKKNCFKKEEFNPVFIDKLFHAWDIACDYPKFEEHLATIYASFINEGVLSFGDLKLKTEPEADTWDDVQYFYKQFLGALLKQKPEDQSFIDGVKPLLEKIDGGSWETFLKKFAS
eukprot:TRINITY_DN1048_c0_g1_i1.p1 TRINITY_DN1048_c0_g1~~TRINITY_DN1048_c0_g1_i1.p1  ORF type:complete len:421 (+),score=160.13 TRINITY_DN1048_c0_g1_i1:64-1326(+)